MKHVPGWQADNLWHWLAMGLGSGLAPKAPGTFGSLAALILWLPLALLPLPGYLLLVLLAGVVGIYICDRVSKDMKVHDHSAIVWDEFVGLWIGLAALPLNWTTALLGFALFRLFDIWKPWPIGLLDRNVHGGLGIMLDDVLAGFYTLIVMHLLYAAGLG
ncbi:MAG TPA: phosphatidylglycerophosphatase A [Pseudomonadales bacterium]|nr:phosphatidylglycerophosphatase A [Pseudomonadales bacterium]